MIVYTRNMTERSCGGCTLCCDLLQVESIGKRAGAHCLHCEVGVGCAIYDNRPGECHTFDCGWRQTAAMGEHLRPDRCGVAFESFPPERVLVAQVDRNRPEAHLEEPVKKLIHGMLARGFVVWVVVLGKPNQCITPTNVSRAEASRRTAQAWERVGGRA